MHTFYLSPKEIDHYLSFLSHLFSVSLIPSFECCGIETRLFVDYTRPIFVLVCELIDSGISGLVSDVSCETSQLLNSQLSMYNIPHVSITPQECR